MRPTHCQSTVARHIDAFGNLRAVLLPSGSAITYIIDGKNRRVGKKINGALAEGFIYGTDLQPGAWLDSHGALAAAFIYGLSPTVPEYMIKGGVIYRFIADQVGSVRLVVDAAGQIAQRLDYDEFGSITRDTNPGLQPFGFQGGLRDLDTGLTKFGARDYDATTGRWTTKDPVGLQAGNNVYTFVDGDPLSLMDPDGLGACTVNVPNYPIEYSPGKTSTWLGGHSGVLGYDSEGNTQYYEYGRYPPSGPGIIGERLPTDDGNVRKMTIPDLAIGPDGKPTPESLNALLKTLSRKSGKGTPGKLKCDSSVNEKEVYDYISNIANDKNRRKYSWVPWSPNHCRSFALDAFNAGRHP